MRCNHVFDIYRSSHFFYIHFWCRFAFFDTLSWGFDTRNVDFCQSIGDTSKGYGVLVAFKELDLIAKIYYNHLPYRSSGKHHINSNSEKKTEFFFSEFDYKFASTREVLTIYHPYVSIKHEQDYPRQ